jgi:hypothetical protein
MYFEFQPSSANEMVVSPYKIFETNKFFAYGVASKNRKTLEARKERHCNPEKIKYHSERYPNNIFQNHAGSIVNELFKKANYHIVPSAAKGSQELKHSDIILEAERPTTGNYVNKQNNAWMIQKYKHTNHSSSQRTLRNFHTVKRVGLFPEFNESSTNANQPNNTNSKSKFRTIKSHLSLIPKYIHTPYPENEQDNSKMTEVYTNNEKAEAN